LFDLSANSTYTETGYLRWQLVKVKEGKMSLTPYELIAIGLLIMIFSKQIEEFPPWKKPYMKNSKLARFWILFTD
jgi:hypothetical protein